MLHTAVNEATRALLHGAIVSAGQLLRVEMHWRIARYARDQALLRQRYEIDDDTPIVPYGEKVAAAVERFAAARRGVRFAFTSGSTSTPKKIAFTRARLATIKRGSFSVVARLIGRHPGWRTGLFILAGLKQDDSLTSLLLHEDKPLPSYPLGLLMPAKYASAGALAPLVRSHGATAVRLWLMTLTDPSLLYSTNPSTLAVFFTEVHERWEESTRLVREHAAGTAPAIATQVARRAASRGWRARFARVAAARAPLPVEAWMPGLRGYTTWDGGYVRPFLAQIQQQLPPERYTFYPMYSMSTETVETLTHFDGDDVRFLPIAPRVLYEFVPEGADDLPAQLVGATALAPGKLYAMVVSDAFGLRRYQTDDLFECVARVGDVPDLRFVRRRGLSYSFTGEKLTALQITEAFDVLRAAWPALSTAGVQLTCVPSRPVGEPLPCYRLVLATPGASLPAGVDADAVAARFDRELARINHELAAKLESARLGRTRALVMRYDQLAARLDAKTVDESDVEGRTWDSQFKLLPLYRKTWEEYGG